MTAEGPVRPRRRLLVAGLQPTLQAAIFGLVLAGCGSSAGGSAKPTSTTGSPTKSTSAPGGETVEVRPSSGALGTSFHLQAKTLPVGAKVTFEIDLPNGTTFTGQSHVAGPDGTVATTYRTSASDPTGAYQVKALAADGRQSTGRFDVTPGRSPAVGRTTASTARA